MVHFTSFIAAVLAVAGDPLSFAFPGQTEPSGATHLVIEANEPVEAFELTVTGDGQTIEKQVAALKRGAKYKVKWTQKSEHAKYDLVIRGGGLRADFTFEMVKPVTTGKLTPLRPKSSREDVVKRHQVTYETGFPLARYEYKVYDSDGDVIAAAEVTDKPVPEGGSFTISWDSPAEVFMVWTRGDDAHGRFTEFKLVPWSVEIPHTEINFDSGKFDVKSDESAKLDEAVAVAFHELDALERVNAAVHADITPKLYIVGYTDTVGSAAANQKLSRSRAQAIASYFYDHGFWAEIYYAGMGERGLRVETGDNIDEVRNRRALYLIDVQKPAAGGPVPSSWTKLAGARPRPPGFVLPALPPQWANYREERRSGMGSAQPSSDGTSTSGSDSLPDGQAPASASDQPPAQLPAGLADPDHGDAGPPEVGGGKRGCNVGVSGEFSGLWALVALGLSISRRRRR